MMGGKLGTNETKGKLLISILGISIFLIGIGLGRYSKKCPTVLSSTTKSDTIDTYVPITGGVGSPLTVITYPSNTKIEPPTNPSQPTNSIIAQPSHNNQVLDTPIYSTPPSFTSTDTLRWDSLFVAIIDTGNCEGIISRHSTFGGKLKERTITNTITNVVEPKIPFFQLNGGVQTSFQKDFKNLDLGLALQLQMKRKVSIGYSYMFNTRTNNISLLTKIK